MTAAAAPAVLLLMHQGNSFTQEAGEILARRGIALLALSSRPAKEDVFEKSKAYLADWIVTEHPRLSRADVADAVGIFRDRGTRDHGYDIQAAIATFEGYRLLMAELNRELGAQDSSPESLRLALDKHRLRQFLFDCGLSAVRCHLLSDGQVPELDPAVTWFVKPVRGASSFATFILRNIADLKDLPSIREQMRSDRKMSAIFMDRYDFLVEEYVEGPEFSFETVVTDGIAYHIGVHEKARVERQERTTLEGMSISPPVCIDPAIVLEGAQFVSECLSAIGLRAGAFHVEAKYWTDRKRWEVIEVNPRMGGSLINASVQAVTGSSMLELWLDTLLADDAGRGRLRNRLREVSQIEALREGRNRKATVFLSKYGEKGRTVEAIEFMPPDGMKPEILNIHVEQGTELENSDRAICLMDALWQVDCADLRNEVERLDRLADEHFRVQYR